MDSQKIDQYCKVLAASPIFKGLATPALEGLVQAGSIVETQAGKFVLVEKGWVPGIFILVEGSAGVLKNSAEIHILQPGAFFGELSLFGLSEGASASIQAKEKTACLLINASALDSWSKAFPDAERVFLRQMCTELGRRLLSTSKKLT